ncbi:MAG: site-2 protease family protein [Alphaproteobacteria bacterium]|nr:site-2 protease family protein [Alphaproteobacteria bacterium]
MGTPVNLGKIFGVNVRIDISLFLVAAIFLLNGLQFGGLQGMLTEATFVVLLFFCVYLHEMGHAFGASLFRIRTLDVTLTFFGGYARLAGVPRGSLQEIVVAFAGPGANLLIAGVLYLWLQNPSTMFVGDGFMIWRLMVANLILGVFNLLPGYPLDGGTIARSVLTNFMPRPRARLIVGYGGGVVGFGLVAYALQTRDFSLTMLLGFYLIYLASLEIQAARSSRF